MFFDTTIDADVGYATSAFHWSVGSDSGPKIVSELQWKKLRGPFARVNLRSEWCGLVFGFVEAEGMRASSGYVTDTDFDGEGRTLMSDRAICDASGSLQGSVRFGLGGSTSFFYSTLKIEASCGYRAFGQWLKMFNGKIIESIYSDVGPIDGLNNRFVAFWRGFEADLIVTKREGPYSAFIDLNVFAPYYSAKGYWNLRTDFIPPFPQQQANDVFGVTVRVGLLYTFTIFNVGLAYQCQHLAAYHGKDMWRGVDGFGNEWRGAGRLNEAILTTSSYTAHLGVVF